jgi:hypothetical protein
MAASRKSEESVLRSQGLRAGVDNGTMALGAHLEGKGLPKVWIQRLPMHFGLVPPPLVWQQVDTNIGVRRTSQVQGRQPLSLQDAHQQLQVPRHRTGDPGLRLPPRASPGKGLETLGTFPPTPPPPPPLAPGHSGSHNPVNTAVVLALASLTPPALAQVVSDPGPPPLAVPERAKGKNR